MWLMRLHNLVSTRIAFDNKYLAPTSPATNLTLTDAPRVVQGIIDTARWTLWPSEEACPQCYSIPLNDRLERFGNSFEGNYSVYSREEELLDYEGMIHDLVKGVYLPSAVIAYLSSHY